MNRKIIRIILVLLVLFSCLNVSASENKEHIEKYVGDIMWKWYGTNWSTGVLPRVEVDSNLIEGEDYVRSYAFTRELVGDVSKLTYLPYEEAVNMPQLPGSVCEKIEGLGNYVSEDVICHVIYGYSYIYADDIEKYTGEEDPEYTFKISNYKNLDFDVLNFFDITVTREEGEEVGEYVLTPEFKLKDESVVALSFTNNESIKSIQYLFKKYGRIILQPVSGKLTIKERESENIEETEEVIKTDEELPMPPKTDIVF